MDPLKEIAELKVKRDALEAALAAQGMSEPERIAIRNQVTGIGAEITMWGAKVPPPLAADAKVAAVLHALASAQVATQAALLHAFRDVFNMPASWNTATPLAQWDGVTASLQGTVTEIDLRLPRPELQGHVDLSALPETLTRVLVNFVGLDHPVDLTKFPATTLSLIQIRDEAAEAQRAAEAARAEAARTSLRRR